MSLRNHLALLILICTLAVLAGCGGSSSPPATPPPGGGFSNSSLKGTYVFSTSGSDINGFFFTMAGVFTANGSGGITSGTIDINDSDTNVSSPVQSFGQAISTSSSYTVGVDGRGKISIPGTLLGTITFDFVLNSPAGGLIIEFDKYGSGSGSLELQTATVTQAQLAQGYAFSLSGFDANDHVLSSAGAFTLDANGNITTTGVYDVNDNQAVSTSQPLTGSVTVGTGGGSGSAAFSTVLGALTFHFYVVDATHFKFIETDPLAAPVVSGDIFQQHAAIPTGTLVFTMAGEDVTTQQPLVFGGFMTSSSPGQISNGSEDANVAGAVATQVAFSLNYTAPVNGRSTMALSTFTGGPTALAVYPSSGGLLMLEIDNGAVSSGVAYVQSATSLTAAPQGYGLNLSAINGSTSTTFELDDIAEFKTAASGGPTGLLDENDQGSPIAPQVITNSSTLGPDSSNPATGRGVATFCSGTCSTNTLFDLIYYTVDGTNTIFIEADSTQLGAGAFQLQSSSGAKAAAAGTRPLLVHPVVMPHSALRRAGVIGGK